MDLEQRRHRAVGSIPRPSKSPLPLPLTTNDNLRAPRTATGREPSRGSNLPRPSTGYGAGAGTIRAPSVFTDHVDLSSARHRYDWNAQARTVTSVRSVKSRADIRDSLQPVADNALATTPPSSSTNGPPPLFEEGDENHHAQHAVTEKKARPPRMSLSERTVETLSHISPSPSPTRQHQESLVSYDARAGRPSRPPSQARIPSPVRSKSRSPVKQPFRPPGRSDSPTKTHRLPAAGTAANPSLPLPRASRVAGSVRLPQRSVSNTAVVNAGQSAQSLAAKSQTMRLRSRHEGSHTPSIGRSPRREGSHTPSIDRSLSSIFSPQPPPPTDRLAISDTKPGSALLLPRSRRQNPTASSLSSRSKKAGVTSTPKVPPVPSQESNLDRRENPKSSAALRSAIAKAKAARKDAASKPSFNAGDFNILASEGSSASEQGDVMESNRGLLQSRVRSALTSGNLNISAMKLGHIPDEVMSMYEPGETSVNWAEVVDLVKFNAADNELSHLEDHVFPDLSLEEASESEEKSNQFGGIESLDLHNNQLSSLLLGLRRLERLTWVNLSGNKLTNECLHVVWQLPKVQDLNLARNQLTGSIEIPSSSLSKLHRLNLSGNSIDALIIDHDTSSPLVSLDVSNNQLADLPWEILASFDLVQLNASANNLVTVIVNPLLRNAFASLKEVDLSRNSIEAIEPELQLPSVQSFAVNSNRLDSLPDISSWQNLITLQAAENKLSEIPPGLMGLTTVKSVDLSLNEIKALDPRIARMESLTSLQLSGNPLRDRKFLSMDTEGIKKALLLRLVEEPSDNNGAAVDTDADIDVDKLGIGDQNNRTTSQSSSSSSSSPYLHTPVNGVLDLSSQGLTAEKINLLSLSAINLESPIHTLRLSNNDIAVFPTTLLLHPSVNASLKSLDMSHNPLAATSYLGSSSSSSSSSSNDILHLPALESLYLVSTGLGSLDPLLGSHQQQQQLIAPRLRELNISCHRLTGPLPPVRKAFPSCTTLLATDNWFSSVSVEAVRGLEVLDIRNNEIDSLPPALGLLGNYTSSTSTAGAGKGREPGRLRSLECGGNRFRVPRITVIEKGTEAVLKDLRRMIPEADVPDDWKNEI